MISTEFWRYKIFGLKIDNPLAGLTQKQKELIVTLTVDALEKIISSLPQVVATGNK